MTDPVNVRGQRTSTSPPGGDVSVARISAIVPASFLTPVRSTDARAACCPALRPRPELPNSGTDEKTWAAPSCHAYNVKEAGGVRLIHEPWGTPGDVCSPSALRQPQYSREISNRSLPLVH